MVRGQHYFRMGVEMVICFESSQVSVEVWVWTPKLSDMSRLLYEAFKVCCHSMIHRTIPSTIVDLSRKTKSQISVCYVWNRRVRLRQ